MFHRRAPRFILLLSLAFALNGCRRKIGRNGADPAVTAMRLQV